MIDLVQRDSGSPRISDGGVWVAPSRPAPIERATFTKRLVLSSRGPAAWHPITEFIEGFHTSGKAS